MRITVDIPDDIAARMLGTEDNQGLVLLKLAMVAALDARRIGNGEGMRLLGSDYRFAVDDELAAIRKEIRVVGEEDFAAEFEGIRIDRTKDKTAA